MPQYAFKYAAQLYMSFKDCMGAQIVISFIQSILHKIGTGMEPGSRLGLQLGGTCSAAYTLAVTTAFAEHALEVAVVPAEFASVVHVTAGGCRV